MTTTGSDLRAFGLRTSLTSALLSAQSCDAASITAALTTAEIGALARIADSSGRLSVIAVDHGDPLVEMLEAAGLSADAEAQRAIKYDIVDTVGREASAVLLDPDVSVVDIVERRALGPRCGAPRQDRV